MTDTLHNCEGHPENDSKYEALAVNKGIEQPPTVNPNIAKRLKLAKRKSYSVDEYVEGIFKGNINMLSQAITMIESSKYEHQEIAQQIIEKCLPKAGRSIRIGITGVPGAGKSTFIESFGSYLTSHEHKLAVLAIDPSSERSKGSILGDKTRMEQLCNDPKAFIRPSPSAGTLGGVARKTRESMILCEAAGFDTIIIETVGVGQSETAVKSMVDFFLLLKIAGAGDELQGIKRGIMEMADAIAINKADGNNIEKAQLAKAQFKNALMLFPPHESEWNPKVLTCSAIENTGIKDIWECILEYVEAVNKNNYFDRNRSEQAKYWMYETINERLKSNFYHNDNIKDSLPKFENDVLEHKISSFIAAHKLLDDYYKSIK
jgi:LAO/AO transport system kinase